MIGRAGVGAGLVRIDGDDSEQARVIGRLRHSPHVGNVSWCAARRGSRRSSTSGGRKAIASAC